MKPIRLKMCAFGPYADEQELDFTLLGNQKLFLICGQTGAGKTTILDAMCYALYGKTGGGLRNGETMRSSYADLDTETKVEFDFAIGNDFYRVIRKPTQEHTRKKGDLNKSVTRQGKAELFEIDDKGNEIKLIAAKGVDYHIEKLIGVGVDQFRQIILLPQGDFRKLLLADSKERQGIMQQLFKTQMYASVENLLKKKYREIEKFYEEDKIRYNTILANCDAENEEELKVKEKNASTELENESEKLKIANEKQQEFTKIYDREKSIYDAYMRINEIEKEEKNLKLKEPDMKKLFSDMEKVKRASHLKEAFQLIEEIKTEGVEKKKLFDEKYGIYEKAYNSEKEIYKEKEFLDKEEQQHNKNVQELLLLKNIRPLAQGYSESVLKCNLLKSELEKQEKILEEIQVKIKLAEETSLNKKKTAVALQEVFLKGQSAYLASHLKDGSPCPVCGSTEHPLPAHSNELLPDKKDVDRASSEAEQAMKNEKDLKEKANKQLTDKINPLKLQLVKSQEVLIQTENQVEEKYRNIEELDKKIENSEKANKHYEERYKHVEEELKKTSEITASLKGELARLDEEVKSLRVKYEDRRNELEARSKEEGFADRKESAEYFKRVNELSKMEKEYTEYISLCKAISKRLEKEHNYIGEKTCPDMETLEKKRNELLADVKEATVKEERLKGIISQYGKAKKELGILAKHGKELDEKYKLVGGLSELVSGKETGINLERFVLGALLDEVTQKANLRLDTMSGGRYELNRRLGDRLDARKTAGLDLEVFDSYTGKARPASTLSGGETFLASMSLALGLADVVQEYSGGIKLDAMFIDEGFGTLDSESLDLSLKTLTTVDENEESPRLVGIISHVEGLEERIPAKLRVDKTKKGSRAYFDIA